MKGVGGAEAVLDGVGRQSGLGEGEVGAELGVLGVARGVHGDEGAVGVVAAEEEDADQGLVAGRAGGVGIGGGEAAEAGHDA